MPGQQPEQLQQKRQPQQAVIALGSNLGESATTLSAAAERIAATPGIEQIALSSIYTSQPAIVTEQPLFMNAVMLVTTELEPEQLLRTLQAIETDFGRVREGDDYVPFGPRTLDLDIIDIEGVVLEDPELTLPHPQALHRDFVVTPLLEISPHHVFANNKVVNHNAVDCGIVLNTNMPWSEGAEAAGGTEGAETVENSAESKPDKQEGRLFVCATPIGNLGDITLRVLETLQDADLIYCEDTRVTRKLTSRFDISTSLRRADAHKLPELLPTIFEQLEEGLHLAYVSDAGMPGISDPGSLLVSAVREEGYSIEILPGASALTTAIAASGIKAHNHYFGGFFPRKSGAGKRLLEELASLDDTMLVFYESVHRTAKTLKLFASIMPERQVVMARELTKLHEEIASGTALELSLEIARRVEGGRSLKGEVVLLIAPK